MKLDSQALANITRLTLEEYSRHAEDFWKGTRDHDVSQNVAALLQYIESSPPFRILDFGCGPGRDLKVFAELGHIAVGLEGAPAFAAMARAYSGCEVWQQDLPTQPSFTCRARSSRACCSSCTRVSSRAACCFAQIRAAITRRDGPAAATARTMISRPGGAMRQARDSSSSLTITARPGCRASASRGSRASGAVEAGALHPQGLAACMTSKHSIGRINGDAAADYA